MPRDKDYQLNIRIPTSTRNAVTILGRMCGLNTSEMFRWLIERAIIQDSESTVSAVVQLAIAKYGVDTAERMYELEMKRLQLLLSGEAVETPDGSDITLVTPPTDEARHKATTATQDAVAV